jgi:hypothetical protein
MGLVELFFNPNSPERERIADAIDRKNGRKPVPPAYNPQLRLNLQKAIMVEVNKQPKGLRQYEVIVDGVYPQALLNDLEESYGGKVKCTNTYRAVIVRIVRW